MKKILFFILMILTCNMAKAENFFGGYIGGNFPNKATNHKATENTYINNPSIRLGTVDATDLTLENSGLFGVRLGHYLNEGTSFGFEVDASYSTPNFVQQDVYFNFTQDVIINNQVVLPKGYLAGEHQLPAQFHAYTLGLDALYRYEIQKGIRPYIGAGPSINYLDIEGSGDSAFQIYPNLASGYTPMPYMHSHGWGWGFLAKAGIEWDFAPGYALTAEYRYSQTNFNVDWFRSFTDITAVYTSNAATLGVVAKF
jgi:opacity protein-like surface antigen